MRIRSVDLQQEVGVRLEEEEGNKKKERQDKFLAEYYLAGCMFKLAYEKGRKE